MKLKFSLITILLCITLKGLAFSIIDDFGDYLADLKSVGILNDSQILQIKKDFPNGLSEDEYEKIWKYSNEAFVFDLKKHRGQSYEKIINNLYSDFINKFFPQLMIENISIKEDFQLVTSYSAFNGEIRADTSAFLRVSYSFNNENYSDILNRFKSYSLYWKDSQEKNALESPTPYLGLNFFNDILAQNKISKRVVLPYIADNQGREFIVFLVVNEEQFSQIRSQGKNVFSTSSNREAIIKSIKQFSELGTKISDSPLDIYKTFEKYRNNASTANLEFPVLLSFTKPNLSSEVSFLLNTPINYAIFAKKALDISNNSNINFSDNSEVLKQEIQNKKTKSVYKCTIIFDNKSQNFEIPVKLDDELFITSEKKFGTAFLQFLNKTLAFSENKFYLADSGQYGAVYLMYLNLKQKTWLEENGCYLNL